MTQSRTADLAARYWNAYCAAHPLAATSLGDHRFDNRLDDLRPEATARHRGALTTLLTEAKAERAADDSVTAAALVAQIEGDLAAIDADTARWTVDPIEGPQVQVFNVESYQRPETVAGGQAMVARWHAMGPYLDQHRDNLRHAIADGHLPVGSPVGRVTAMLEEVLARPDDLWALLNPLRTEHPGWPAAERTAFQEGLRSAVATGIRPALARLRTTLEDEVRPHARPDERPGLMHVPGGADAYRLLVRHHTSLDIEPGTLHGTGLDEVRRINGELERLGERVLRTRDRAEILRRLRGDPALHFSTEDEVADAAAAALARAREAIPAWFGVLPKADCVVVRMGAHEAEHGTIAYYRPPSPDGSRPGQYFINTAHPGTRPRYEAEALAFHESIPGHHLQIAIAQEISGLPDFRRHLGVTAFWEGWGLYTERLSDEMGLYSGDLDRIGILSFDAWRACRLVVDTGMHALGWTRRQAIDFMVANTALAPNNIANEVDRYIVWPGQALAYKAGQLEMLRLRADAQAALGPRFDLRAFHDALLGNGALGLGPTREIVQRRLGFGGG